MKMLASLRKLWKCSEDLWKCCYCTQIVMKNSLRMCEDTLIRMYELKQPLQKLFTIVFESINKLKNLTSTWSNLPQSSCDSHWFQQKEGKPKPVAVLHTSWIKKTTASAIFLHKHYASWSHTVPIASMFGICTYIHLPWKSTKCRWIYSTIHWWYGVWSPSFTLQPWHFDLRTCILASKFCHSSCRTKNMTPQKNKISESIKKDQKGRSWKINLNKPIPNLTLLGVCYHVVLKHHYIKAVLLHIPPLSLWCLKPLRKGDIQHSTSRSYLRRKPTDLITSFQPIHQRYLFSTAKIRNG